LTALAEADFLAAGVEAPPAGLEDVADFDFAMVWMVFGKIACGKDACGLRAAR
jgi:hypothetical protein